MAALLWPGCGAGSQQQPDQGVDTVLDTVQPPDMGDGGQAADGSVGNIGQPCDVEQGSGCTGGTVCLIIGDKVGICVREHCTREDLETPTIEDDCPAGTACATVPVEESGSEPFDINVCLATCTPTPTGNACEATNPQLACDPLSIQTTGHVEVCLFPACASDKDCSNDALNPQRYCDTTTGVCFNLGAPAGAVGAACKMSKDCGGNQICFSERQVDNRLLYPGGYCTIVGCKYQGPWACPSGSACFGLGSESLLTLCLETGCEAGKPCRKGYDCLDVGDLGVCWIDPTP